MIAAQGTAHRAQTALIVRKVLRTANVQEI